MTAAAVLTRLHDLGVVVVARGESLALRPASAVPPALLAEVRLHKAEVLALLAANDMPLSDDQCDAAAIRAEMPLPPPGTPERGRMDRENRDVVVGLFAASMRRPPSWWNLKPHDPTPGSACFCCFNRHWWTSDRLGWCCWTCHPPSLPLPARMTVVEVVT